MAKKSILWYVFIGSRGGETRRNIVESIMENPKNPREISIDLEKDYTTITHSIRVLEKNRVLYVPEKKYGAKYQVTPEFLGMFGEYEQLLVREKLVVPVVNVA